MRRALALAALTLMGPLTGLTGVNVAGAQSACAGLGGNIQSGNVCHVNVATPTYVVDLRYNTDYPDDRPVADYLTETRDRIVGASLRPGAQHLPYQMVVNSDSFRSGQPTRSTQELGQPWHGTQSLVLRTFKSVEGAVVGTQYKSFTFDFDQNRAVTFENLFAAGTNPVDSIYPVVAANLAREHLDRHFKLAPGPGRDPTHYQNFAITDDAVIFFFSAGELMTPEAGYFYAPVPRSKLPPLQI